MTNDSTRREFIKVLAAGGAVCGVAPAWTAGSGARCHAADAKPTSPGAALDPKAVEAEMQRRARGYLPQRRLVVDYYRIGRKLAYPLPLTSLPVPDVPVPGIPGYPWSTWLSWTLEERILALGWVAEWFEEKEARNAAAADLAALAALAAVRKKPQFGSHGTHSLDGCYPLEMGGRRPAAQAARSVPPPRGGLSAGLRQVAWRGADQGRHPPSKRASCRVAQHRPHQHGGRCAHGRRRAAPCRVRCSTRDLNALFGAVLELRAKGFSEGVAYDGYVLDFIADWLSTLPEKDRSPILDHPHLDHYLDQSYMLSAPGAAEQVAEIGDVEPREMPFHLSAQAKLLGLRGNATRAWHLARCPLDWFRTDGLAALRSAKSELSGKTPPAGALDAHYAAVLRTGWEADDVAVAVSCTNSPMGHIPSDNGTLVLGTRGKWLIADPGYQQYAKGDEREFTIGPTAHNAPLINGTAQTQKQPRRLVLEEVGPSVRRVAIDLTACYPSSVPLTTLGATRLALGQEPGRRRRPAGRQAAAAGHLPLARAPGLRLVGRGQLGAADARRGAALVDLPPSPAFRRQPAPTARIARPALAGLPARKGRTGGLVGLRVGRRAPRAAGGPRRPADPPPGPDVCRVILWSVITPWEAR